MSLWPTLQERWYCLPWNSWLKLPLEEVKRGGGGGGGVVVVVVPSCTEEGGWGGFWGLLPNRLMTRDPDSGLEEEEELEGLEGATNPGEKLPWEKEGDLLDSGMEGGAG